MNNMVAAVRKVLSNYATFTGRASRPEFWWWILAVFLATLAAQAVDAILIGPILGFDFGDESAGQPVSLLLSLAIFLPALAVGARRLHDMGKSGWWLLIGFVPIVGVLVLLWFYTQPSEGPNAWGAPDPLIA